MHFRCNSKMLGWNVRVEMTVSRNVETCSYNLLGWCCLSFSAAKGWSGPTLQLFASWSFGPRLNMSAKAAISKEVFIPHDEKMLAAVQVKRRTKKKIPFLATGGQGDYMTFICLSGQRTNATLLFSLIFPSGLTLMSTLAFKLPLPWNANWIYRWVVGQFVLNVLDFAWNWTASQQTIQA